MYDVIIVGSGPAGSMAAISLARQGLKVCLIERSAHPRYKVCGGGLLARAARLLPIDLKAAVDHACRSVELRFQGEKLSFQTERSNPVIHMTMRSTLDGLLVAEARRCGALLHEESPVTGLVVNPDHVVVQTVREPHSGRFVIAADGVDSRVALAAGWPANRHAIPALECEVPVAAATLARFTGVARFDMDHPVRGYSWVFPKKEHLSIGVLSTVRGNQDLREAFHRYLRRLGVESAGPQELHGALIPLRPRHARLAGNRVLLAGDAAGLADPITAEGLTNALLSGKLAAQAILDGELAPTPVADRYCRLLEEEILGELRIAGRLAQWFYGHPTLRNLLFRSHGQRFCEKVSDIMMGERRYADFDLTAGALARYLKPW